MGYSRQEYWNGLPFLSLGTFLVLGSKSESPALQGGFLSTGPPGKCPYRHSLYVLLSRVSRVQLCVTPQMAAHQAPPSLGFSRQEHWSGLPFPSPMHEREKWKWSRSVVSDSLRPHGRQPTRLLHPWDSPGKSTGVGCHCLLRFICAKSLKLCLTLHDPWTNIAWQALLSMGSPRQKYWSGLPCPPSGDLPDPGIKLTSLMSPALAGGFFSTCTTSEAQDTTLRENHPQTSNQTFQPACTLCLQESAY